MTPSWYDVLDVDPSASESEIREAWKSAIADLDPTDRRFKRCSAAAEVLLDPERRAAHDAQLAAEAAAEEDSGQVEQDEVLAPRSVAPTETASKSGRRTGRLAGATAAVWARRTPRTKDVTASDAGSRRSRLWLLPAGLGVLALVLVVVTVLALTRGSDARPLPDDSDVAAAQSAAETAVVPIVSFDYRSLDDDKAAAEGFMTDRYRAEYDRIFSAAIETNAPRLQAVVRAQLLSSGIVRTGPDQVDVLTFVNRTRRNTQNVQLYREQVVLRMVDQGDRWLVDCLITTPGGTCGSGSGD